MWDWISILNIMTTPSVEDGKGRMMMKLKPGFVLQDVAGQAVVLPSGDDLDLNMMIALNDTGRFLWERLEKGADIDALVAALLDEYEVSEAVARNAVVAFVAKLKENDLIAD